MLSPPLNKLFLRALHFNPSTESFILVPEGDGFFGNQRNTVLRDGRSSGVSASVLEEMQLVFEGLNVDAPPASFLLAEELFELSTRNPRDKLTGLRGRAKDRNYGSLPRSHGVVTIVEDAGTPNFGRVV